MYSCLWIDITYKTIQRQSTPPPSSIRACINPLTLHHESSVCDEAYTSTTASRVNSPRYQLASASRSCYELIESEAGNWRCSLTPSEQLRAAPSSSKQLRAAPGDNCLHNDSPHKASQKHGHRARPPTDLIYPEITNYSKASRARTRHREMVRDAASDPHNLRAPTTVFLIPRRF